MVTALVKNRPNFVEFFIDEELVDLSTCLTKSVLRELYNSNPTGVIFRKLAKKFKLKQTNDAWPLEEIGKLIHTLSGTFDNQWCRTETPLFQHPFQVRFANCSAPNWLSLSGYYQGINLEGDTKKIDMRDMIGLFWES